MKQDRKLSQLHRGRRSGGFFSSISGTSAIEFGLIAPLLLTIVVSVSDVTNIAVGVGAMQTGMRAAIQYAMNGGTDMTVAQTQGVQAWTNEPAGGTLTATQSCQCSGASHSCLTLCTDGTSPQMYITVAASAPMGGSMITQTESLSETVRVR